MQNIYLQYNRRYVFPLKTNKTSKIKACLYFVINLSLLIPYFFLIFLKLSIWEIAQIEEVELFFKWYLIFVLLCLQWNMFLDSKISSFHLIMKKSLKKVKVHKKKLLKETVQKIKFFKKVGGRVP